MKRPSGRMWFIPLMVVVLAILRAGSSWLEPSRQIPEPSRQPAPSAPADSADADGGRGASSGDRYEVVRVVDGDTLVVRRPLARRSEDRLRLLGVDAPESVKPDHPVEPWGLEATEFVREMLAAHETVRVVFDRRRRDRYGRLLGYVYVDGRMLNEELLRAGLARLLVYREDSQQMGKLLQAAAGEARKAERGIWSGDRRGRSGR